MRTTPACIAVLLAAAHMIGGNARAQPYDYRVIRDIRYATPQAAIGDMFIPVTADTSIRFPGIINIPGGGWVGETKDTHHNQDAAADLARAGFVSFVTDYTCRDGLAAYPIWDNKTAVRFMRKNAATYQIDPDHIGSMGFSAGGWSTYFLGFTNAQDTIEQADTLGNPLTIPMEPHWREHPEYSSQVQAILPVSGGGWGWHEATLMPLLLNKTREQLPACLLVEGATEDTTIDLRYAAVLESKGVDCTTFFPEGFGHAFSLRPPSWEPQTYNFMPMVEEFFRRTLGGGHTGLAGNRSASAGIRSTIVKVVRTQKGLRIAVNAHGPHRVLVLDPLGRMIRKTNGVGAQTYDVTPAGLGSGARFVAVHTHGHRTSLQVILQ